MSDSPSSTPELDEFPQGFDRSFHRNALPRTPQGGPPTASMEVWAGVAVVGLVTVLAIPVWAVELGTAESMVLGPFWFWNVLYLAYLAAFCGSWFAPVSGRTVTARSVFAVQVVAGIGVVALSPGGGGFTAILLIFTAASATYFLAPRGVIALIVTNTAVLAASEGIRHQAADTITVGLEVGFDTLMYALLQAMVAYMTWGQQREARAMQQLAVAHTDLRAASALLAESSQSRERLRIARELHDLMGHKLTALPLELETASHRAAEPARIHVTRSRDLAKELLSEVRDTVGELRSRPPEFRAALEQLVADVPVPAVHLTVDDAVEPDETCANALIRSVQEVLTNTIRHAEAENLWIEVAAAPSGAITVTARDRKSVV